MAVIRKENQTAPAPAPANTNTNGLSNISEVSTVNTRKVSHNASIVNMAAKL